MFRTTKLTKFSVVFVWISSFCRFCYLEHLYMCYSTESFLVLYRNAMVDLKKKTFAPCGYSRSSAPLFFLIIQIFEFEKF